MADRRTEGLYHKFNVERTDGTSEPGKRHHGCDYFVLDSDARSARDPRTENVCRFVPSRLSGVGA